MVIKDINLSFVQTQVLSGPLASLSPPPIPYTFLLSEPLYQEEIGSILSGASSRRLPWDGRAGKLFWFYYLEQTRARDVKPKNAWRGLVPIRCDLNATVSSTWVPGTVQVHGYLYPWGIALVVDVQAKGSWSLDRSSPTRWT